MSQIVLDVPFVTQLGFGDPANLKNDHTGCWYAMACMVGAFFEAGPRLGAPQLYKPGLGSFADGTRTYGHKALMPGSEDERGFLEVEDLERVSVPASRRWNAENLAMLLRKHGPIGFYWIKTSGGATYGHASVLIGVIDQTVIYHDPENDPRVTMRLSEFNDLLYWDIPTVMVRRKGPAFQATPNFTTFKPAAPKPKQNVQSNMKGSGFFGRLRGRR